MRSAPAASFANSSFSSGSFFSLIALDFHRIVVRFSRKLLVRIVIGVARFELLGFPGSRAAKIFRKARQRFFRAQWNQEVVGLHRFAAARRGADQLI